MKTKTFTDLLVDSVDFFIICGLSICNFLSADECKGKLPG